MKETRYFVKDIVNTERPLMGRYGVYCTTLELFAEYGMLTEDEAWKLCEQLWKDDCPYFNGDYEIIGREVEMDPEAIKAFYDELDDYITKNSEPAPAAETQPEADEQLRLFEEAARRSQCTVAFADFEAMAKKDGGFEPEDAKWYSKVVAQWALGKLPVIWAYCREWGNGAVVFTDVEPYYSGIDETCEVRSKWLLDFGEHCARVNFY